MSKPYRRPEGCPAFIVGCHRSGTTLVRRLFDAHPNIACPPESKFIAGFEAFLRYPQVLAGLSSMGIPRVDVLECLGRLADGWFLDYARRQGKRRWVDKTPNYYRLLPLIDLMFSGTARYILIVRHPLDVVQSLSEAPAFQCDHPEDPDIATSVSRYGRSREAWAYYWRDVSTTLIAFTRSCESRSFIFRYEDLVTQPDAVLAKAFGFLGETLPEELLATWWTIPMTPGYADWKTSSSTGIYQSSQNRWTDWSKAEIASVWSIVSSTAALLDYSIEL